MSQKDKLFNLRKLFQASYKSTSSLHKSTNPEVGRPDRSTDVHKRARLCVLEDGRPYDRQRFRLSAPVGRSTRRSTVAPTVGFLTVGGRPHGSTGSSDRPQRLYFSGL